MRNASVVYVVRNDRDDKLSGPFGRLTVTGPAVRKGSNYVVPVRCDCGETLTVQRNNLVSGRTKSCGCLHREQAAVTGRANRRHEKAPRRPSTRPRRTHGGSRTRAYFSWRGMQQRCTNPRDKSFARYGGRGIRVCARWQSFELFLADMGERPARTTIDRIDNERGYECGRSECADCGPLGRTCTTRALRRTSERWGRTAW